MNVCLSDPRPAPTTAGRSPSSSTTARAPSRNRCRTDRPSPAPSTAGPNAPRCGRPREARLRGALPSSLDYLQKVVTPDQAVASGNAAKDRLVTASETEHSAWLHPAPGAATPVVRWSSLQVV